MRFFYILFSSFLWGLSHTQDPRSGAHSEKFDPIKYTFTNEVLITPKTHPNLFSFTGRWLRSPDGHPHSPAIHSTLWPGNAVTVLFYGKTATLKLLPLPQGVVEYAFVVSVNSGKNVRYVINNFDTSTKSHLYSIKVDSSLDKAERMETSPTILKPHTVRITSIMSSPISFQGLFVENTQIAQGRVWKAHQLKRHIIEFVGEGSDAERPGGFFRTDPYTPFEGAQKETAADAIFSTVQYKLAERLVVQHSHISAGVCLLSDCDDQKKPGLETQYFNISPQDYSGELLNITDPNDPRYIDNLQTLFRFPALTSKPDIPLTPPTLVVVDTGVLDILVHKKKTGDYTHVLARFLARMRNTAHPFAKILVIARQGTPSPESTTLNVDDSERDALYQATRTAVRDLEDAKIIFTPVYLKKSEDIHDSYLRALCPHILEEDSIFKKTREIFSRPDPNTQAQKVCMEILGTDTTKESSGSIWISFLVLGLAVGGLIIAKDTVLGALAAILSSLGILGKPKVRITEESSSMQSREFVNDFEVEGLNDVKIR